jgi:hypothetical protein
MRDKGHFKTYRESSFNEGKEYILSIRTTKSTIE